MENFLKRTLFSVLSMGLVFILSRSIIRFLPGNPIETLIAESGTFMDPEVLLKELNLDQPFWISLWIDFQNFIQGDWGKSLLSGLPIRPIFLERLENTLLLAAASILFSLVFSLALGLLSASKNQSFLSRATDSFCSGFGALAAALPVPWIGPIFLYLLAVQFPLFPPQGHWFLPALTLSVGYAGVWSRLIRERVREVLQSDMTRSARSRGVSEFWITLKYGLAPASSALLGHFGTQLGGILAGAFITETIFQWPGLGLLFIEAVLARDYLVVEVCVFFTGSFSIFGVFLGDLLKQWADPRQKTD
jgi:peptide/nickel transport system permease protein